MSAVHLLCESTGSTLTARTFTPRFLKSAERRATSPSSVVHTGVKSLGCEKSTTHESPLHLWKSILPCVVSEEKSGAMSPRRRFAASVLMEGLQSMVEDERDATNGRARRQESLGEAGVTLSR